MSGTAQSAIVNPDSRHGSNEALGQGQPAQSIQHKNYKGFVAGVFSGIAKLSVGHPFDTIKVRLQTSERVQFKGPLDCLLQTLKNEGARGLYKGATPPLIGWMFMDSIMLGSLTFYRRILHENVFSSPSFIALTRASIHKICSAEEEAATKLPTIGHAIAGVMAGATVSFIAAPVEHIKARLQVQYAANKSQRLYKGPIDCSKKILRVHGIAGIYHGLSATLVFRSFFFFWWGFLRRLHSPSFHLYESLNPCYKLLGRWPLGSGFLAYLIPFRCY
ncbi:hypothetical protein ABVK25_005898 [Lepraria finkii]|uniref:Uncharacterized protein n=1 Tax=Lepraria finkii TaxID=1340010 RepID=A0ABR4B7X5_9LECA